QETRIAGAQPQNVRIRRHARVLASGLLAIPGDDTGDERAVTISLIRIRQAGSRQRIVEADSEALRIGELDILNDATGQISVCSINSGVEYRHRDTASTHR